MKKPLHLTIYSEFDLETLMDAEELVGTLQLEPKELPFLEEEIEQEQKELLKAWRDIKEYVRIEFNMNKKAFATWIKPLEIDKIIGNTVYLKHPDDKLKEYIERKYFTNLMGAAIDILDKAYSFEFTKEEGTEKSVEGDPRKCEKYSNRCLYLNGKC